MVSPPLAFQGLVIYIFSQDDNCRRVEGTQRKGYTYCVETVAEEASGGDGLGLFDSPGLELTIPTERASPKPPVQSCCLWN